MNSGYPYFDVHVHFVYQCSRAELRHAFDLFEKNGLAGMSLFVLAEFPSEIDTVLKMIPGEFHPSITEASLERQRDPFGVMNLPRRLKIVPFLDARFIDDQIEAKIKTYHRRGFQGVKLLYVPEEDVILKVGGMEKAFGRTQKQSEKITSLIVGEASMHGMPVLIHVDLRKYRSFIAEIIKTHSRINFCIAHFGFSRRTMSVFLEDYPNCYTDMSSLVPFFEKDPLSYKNFMKQYQDRILFGSDALVAEPERVQSLLQFVNQFLGDEEIFYKIANKNYMDYMSHERSITHPAMPPHEQFS